MKKIQLLLTLSAELDRILEDAYIKYRAEKRCGSKQDMIRETLMKVFSK